MITTLRVLAILCGLFTLVVGLVWVYWIALVAWLVGAVGFGLARWADRREWRQSLPPFRFQRILGRTARWINVGAFACSLVALMATSLRG
ncbi:hypothetical protein [Oleiharenicola lentus]|uniref:hypothetical protein n=1 Tax=Oleiharenicola lentus TaxID=2508720 RepID=UPI003F67D415